MVGRTPSKMTRTPSYSLRGAVMVEAACAVPVFLVSLLSAIYILLLAFRVVTMQFSVGEIAREVGTRQPGAEVTLSYVRQRTSPLLGYAMGVTKVELNPPLDGEGSESSTPPPPGSIFTIRISSESSYPLIGSFKLRASAVGVMERLQ